MSTWSKVIGLAGTFASGKDTLAEYLVSTYHYDHVSTSDIVRELAMEKYGSIERPVLFKVATETRYERGAGIFVQLALKRADNRPVIISGIRTLGESRAITAAGGVLMFIDAPIEVRYKRMMERRRDIETELTLEDFAANEQKEWYGGADPADFNLRDIKKTADISIDNTLTLDEFYQLAERELEAKA